MSIKLNLSGEGVQYEKEIDRQTAFQIMEYTMLNGDSSGLSLTHEADSDADYEDTDAEHNGLPGNFFDRLSGRQEAYLRILIDDGDWVFNDEVRQRIDDEYGKSMNGPQAMSGVRAGFTRKYGKDFDVDESRWRGSQKQYRLNPKYIDELREGLAQLDEE